MKGLMLYKKQNLHAMQLALFMWEFWNCAESVYGSSGPYLRSLNGNEVMWDTARKASSRKVTRLVGPGV